MHHLDIKRKRRAGLNTTALRFHFWGCLPENRDASNSGKVVLGLRSLLEQSAVERERKSFCKRFRSSKVQTLSIQNPRQEGACALLFGVREYLFWGSLLQYPPRIEEQNPMRHLACKPHLVRRDDHRSALVR